MLPEIKPAEKADPESWEGIQAYLHLHSDILDDLMQVRIATENRIRSLKQGPEEGGNKGVPEELLVLSTMPKSAIVRLEDYCKQLKKAEEMAAYDLEKHMKEHPLWNFAVLRLGVGEKGMGMLLGHIGWPGRFHSYQALWRYCGFDVGENGKTPRKQSGQKLTYNPKARSTVRMMIDSGAMNGQRWFYWGVYQDAKEKYRDPKYAYHKHPCGLCSPKHAPPAPVGSEVKPRHQDWRARRYVAKRFLRELWQFTRKLERDSKA